MPSQPQTIQVGGAGVDLSPRLFTSTTVAASPAGASETTICTLTVSNALVMGSGILLFGSAAFTVGTNGTAVTMKIRRTDTSGATIFSSGATTAGVAAAALMQQDVQGLDTAVTLPGQVYVLTLTVTGGSAASTVSAANLIALVI